MVADPHERYHFCVGNFVSGYYLGKAGNCWQPDRAKPFYSSISICIEPADKSAAHLFYRGSDGCNRTGLCMAGIWLVQTIFKQSAGGLGHCGSAADTAAVCYQCRTIQNDIRTMYGYLGHTDHLYLVDCGVHDFCL